LGALGLIKHPFHWQVEVGQYGCGECVAFGEGTAADFLFFAANFAN